MTLNWAEFLTVTWTKDHFSDISSILQTNHEQITGPGTQTQTWTQTRRDTKQQQREKQQQLETRNDLKKKKRWRCSLRLNLYNRKSIDATIVSRRPSSNDVSSCHSGSCERCFLLWFEWSAARPQEQQPKQNLDYFSINKLMMQKHETTLNTVCVSSRCCWNVLLFVKPADSSRPAEGV